MAVLAAGQAPCGISDDLDAGEQRKGPEGQRAWSSVLVPTCSPSRAVTLSWKHSDHKLHIWGPVFSGYRPREGEGWSSPGSPHWFCWSAGKIWGPGACRAHSPTAEPIQELTRTRGEGSACEFRQEHKSEGSEQCRLCHSEGLSLHSQQPKSWPSFKIHLFREAFPPLQMKFSPSLHTLSTLICKPCRVPPCIAPPG